MKARFCRRAKFVQLGTPTWFPLRRGTCHTTIGSDDLHGAQHCSADPRRQPLPTETPQYVRLISVRGKFWFDEAMRGHASALPP